MRRWLWWMGAVSAAAILAFAIFRPLQVLPRLGPILPFQLVDDARGPFRAVEPAGRVVLYTLGTARDTEKVQRTWRLWEALAKGLAQRGWLGRGVEMAFVSIDPDPADAAQLRRLGEALPAELRQQLWFLRGPQVAVKLALGTGLGLYFEAPERVGAGWRWAYTPTVVVVDGHGQVRGRYPVATAQADTLLQHLELLQREVAATGVSRLAYSAAHLFLCYPR